MARIRYFDEKSVKNRNRVRLFRYNKKMKTIHNNQVHERMKILTDNQMNFNSLNDHDPNEKKFDRQMTDIDEATELKDKLRIWIVNHRITTRAVKDLLSILRCAGHSFLPKDCRTLMKTPTKVPIDILSNGKLFYYGIQKCLGNVLANIQQDIIITLDFNFDGFPISKSSNNQFWPILASIRGKVHHGEFVNLLVVPWSLQTLSLS